jgi:hypothetical protein
VNSAPLLEGDEFLKESIYPISFIQVLKDTALKGAG